MSRLLHIAASPMDELSFSGRVADSFLEAYRLAHPEDEIEQLNIWQADLPIFDGSGVRARFKSTRGLPLEQPEADAWQQVLTAVNHFKQFDKYLISTPMWNFGIPWRLKQYIDLLAHPGLTFSYSPDTGYAGLLNGKRAAVICARGGAYPEGTPAASYDFQKPYLALFLNFVGITDQQFLMVEPTMGVDTEQLLADARTQARALAGRF